MNNFTNAPLNYVDIPPQYSNINNDYKNNYANAAAQSNKYYHDLNNDNLIQFQNHGRNYVIPNNLQPKPKFLDSNFTDNAVDLQILEVPLIIDSKSRDITYYQNPFQYNVILKPSNISPAPYIINDFKNIKYMKLDIGALPNKYYLVKTILDQSGQPFTYLDSLINNTFTDSQLQNLINETFTNYDGANNNLTIVNITWTRDISNNLIEWNIEAILNGNVMTLYSYDNNNSVVSYYNYAYDEDYDLANSRYIVLNIKEVNDVNENATDNSVSNSFSVMYPVRSTHNIVYFDSNDTIKTYMSSNLNNLNKLTISMFDPLGRQLIAPNLNYNITTPNNCICTLNNDGTQNTIYNCASHYIRHPYYCKLMNTIQIKLGLYQKHIDNLVTKG